METVIGHGISEPGAALQHVPLVESPLPAEDIYDSLDESYAWRCADEQGEIKGDTEDEDNQHYNAFLGVSQIELVSSNTSQDHGQQNRHHPLESHSCREVIPVCRYRWSSLLGVSLLAVSLTDIFVTDEIFWGDAVSQSLCSFVVDMQPSHGVLRFTQKNVHVRYEVDYITT